MTVEKIQISLFHVKNRLKSKIGLFTDNVFCSAFLRKPAVTTIVASELLFCHRRVGCFKDAGDATHLFPGVQDLKYNYLQDSE